jgi:class 3 adenylate cyclase/tetratricopeptide (TPR) repeat protein
MDRERALLQTVGAYVPALLIRRVAQHPDLVLEGWQESIEAVMLFADVSGFTRMSETLARLGKEGAEELTRVLNDYFGAMIDLVRAYGGFVVKFGGDAMTCQFPGGERGLALAAACGLAMQDAMGTFGAVRTQGGTFALQMKIGISGGPSLFMSVGRSDRGLEHVLMGRPLDRMAEAEHCAAPGEVVVDATCPYSTAEMWRRSGITPVEERGDFWLLRSSSPDVPLPSPSEMEDALFSDGDGAPLLNELIPFIPRSVYDQITAGHWRFVGEHRRVVSLFVKFAGLDYADTAQVGAHLQTYFVAVQEIVQRYGGRLNRVITGDKGSLLHLIFGAPVAHEDDERRAVLAALAVDEVVRTRDELSFISHQCIGVASGYVFAGNVGSDRRREYTVMGDVVNLSARLMQAAEPGTILLDARTFQRVEAEIDTESLGPLSVKGKAEPVSVWRALGVRQRDRWRQNTADDWLRASPMVGRREEMAMAREIIAKAVQGQGQLLVIDGEAGVGKSRLLAEVAALARERGMVGLGGTCLSHGSQTPYLPWIELLRRYFDVDTSPDDKSAGARLAVIRRILTEIGLGAWTPLVGQMLGFNVPDTPVMAAMSAELRQQRLFNLVLNLLRYRAGQAPLLLVFEDLHWADTVSLNLLNYVARNIADYPIVLVGVHRPTLELESWRTFGHYHALTLTDLPAEDALQLARVRLGMDELPPALTTLLLRGESRVNPFFVEEIINTLIDRDLLVAKGDGAGYRLVGDLNAVDMPESVQALVMSRIDRLDERSKLAVKVASVIGRTFKEEMLRAIFPVPIAAEALHASLTRLNGLDLTPVDKPAPEWEYIFKHIITQEVAYESLLYAHRRELHCNIGAYLERIHADYLEEYYELLAYHYAASGDAGKSWTYLVKAGDKARAQYANEAAINYYEKALSDTPAQADVSIVHESLADIDQLLGRYERAEENYRRALESTAPASARAMTLRRKIARTWALQGRYEPALERLEALQSELAGGQDPLALAWVYDDMGWIARQRGAYEDALTFCLDGLSLIEREDDAGFSLRLGLLHNLGSVYGRIGEYEKAIDYFERCIGEAESRDELYQAASSYINLAVVYWSQGNFDWVGGYLKKSLDMFQQIGSARGTAMCYNNLGGLAYTQGDYTQAIEHYTSSLAIRREIGDRQGIADLYNNLGEVYHALEDGPQALDYLQQAADMFVDLGDNATLVDTYKLLAEVEVGLGKIEPALQYAGRALKLAQVIGNAEYEGVAYRALGEIYRAATSWAVSRTCLEDSVRLLEASGNKLELAQSHVQLGRTLMAMEDRDTARRHLQQAVDLFGALGLDGEMSQARALIEEGGV